MDAVVRYDPEADVLYVQLATGDVARTATLSDLRLIDMSADGTVLGIEFISAGDGVDLSDVPFAPTVERAIGDSGLPIRVLA